MHGVIQWYHGYTNHPLLVLTGDNHLLRFRYQYYPPHYYAESEYLAMWFTKDRHHAGLGGADVNLTLLDNSITTLTGPWIIDVRQINALRLWEQYPGRKAPIVNCSFNNVALGCPLPVARTLSPFPIVCIGPDNKVVKKIPDSGPFHFAPSISLTEVKKPNV